MQHPEERSEDRIHHLHYRYTTKAYKHTLLWVLCALCPNWKIVHRNSGACNMTRQLEDHQTKVAGLEAANKAWQN